jgi:UDP-N-acetyl-D-mannosaminuronic acid dehydrogenase
MLDEVRQAIADKKARLAVIGLGYVGLPIACEFARIGFNVLGVEVTRQRVDTINAGISPIVGKEPGLKELVAEVVAGGRLRATCDYGELADRDVILICVETPVDEHNLPQYEALRSALNALGAVMKVGALVIIESTVAPGTMRNIVLPLLEASSGKRANQGFYLGICPERVMPGKLLSNIRSVSRVVGGLTPETAHTMQALYRHIVYADLDLTDCITAELVKTVENAYRDVQIAFANEMALICEKVGGDVWKVRELVNKSPGRAMLMPGAGVGGHCIPKDPWLLAYSVHATDVDLHVIPAARGVNKSMPLHMVELLETALRSAGKQIQGSQILILGYTYLEDSDDIRNSPSQDVVKILEDRAANVTVHDPYVLPYQGSLLEKASGCDAVMVMVRHKEYQTLDLESLTRVMKTPLMIDGRAVFREEEVNKAGMSYWGLGKSSATGAAT